MFWLLLRRLCFCSIIKKHYNCFWHFCISPISISYLCFNWFGLLAGYSFKCKNLFFDSFWANIHLKISLKKLLLDYFVKSFFFSLRFFSCFFLLSLILLLPWLIISFFCLFLSSLALLLSLLLVCWSQIILSVPCITVHVWNFTAKNRFYEPPHWNV